MSDFNRNISAVPRARADTAAVVDSGLRAHMLTAGARVVDLEPIVRHYDRQTRKEGFHALHDWDGKAEEDGRVGICRGGRPR